MRDTYIHKTGFTKLQREAHTPIQHPQLEVKPPTQTRVRPNVPPLSHTHRSNNKCLLSSPPLNDGHLAGANEHSPLHSSPTSASDTNLHRPPPAPRSLPYLNRGACGWDSSVLSSPNLRRTLSSLRKHLRPGKIERALCQAAAGFIPHPVFPGFGGPAKWCRGARAYAGGALCSNLRGRSRV